MSRESTNPEETIKLLLTDNRELREQQESSRTFMGTLTCVF